MIHSEGKSLLLVRIALISILMLGVLFIPSLFFSQSGHVHAGQVIGQSVPSRIRIMPGNQPPNNAVRSRIKLPSDVYGVRFSVAEITISVPSPAGERTEDLKPEQVGVKRTVGIFSNERGRLFKNADGTSIRMVALKSAGAVQIRVHLEKLNIGEGDEVYVYGTSPLSHVAGPFKARGPFGDGSIWVDSVEGDTIIIEHYIRGLEIPFQISEISHVFKSPQEALKPEVLACEQDASCSTAPEKNAVGRYDFISQDGEFLCTGTLLNDQASDDASYFLTASHCISSQSEANSVEVFWFYQTTACNSGLLRPDIYRSIPTGATFLATDMPSDSTLLSINGAVPSGVVYSGWDTNPRTAGTAVFGLHHPGAGLPPDLTASLKIANGHIADLTAGCITGLMKGYSVNWDSGAAEPGSSGSGLFTTDNGTDHLVGVLSCGPSNPTCEMTGPVLYGKFSDFYPKIQKFLQAGPGCAFTLSTNIQSFGYSGGTGAVIVAATPQCSWSAAVSDNWVAITSGASGSGNGTVAFAAAANPGSTPRTATITIGGQVVTIKEGVSSAAHNSELSVDDGVTDHVIGIPFATVFGANRLTPDAYPATLTAVEISFSPLSFLPTGTPFNVFVGTNPGGSPDIGGIQFKTVFSTVTSFTGFNVVSVPSTTITSGDFVVGFSTTGGTGLFPLSIDQSSPSKRQSYLSVDGKRFAILDDVDPAFAGNLLVRALVNEGTGTCGGSITPTQQQFASSGGMATVNLTTGSCAWTASTTANWITVSPPSGNGSAPVSLTVQPNTAGGARAAAVTIAGQTFLVTESPGDTKPSISSLSADLNGDTLTLTGSAADPGGDITTAQVTLLDAAGGMVTMLPSISQSFGAAPTVNFTLSLNGLSNFPSAVAASLVVTDAAAFSSSAMKADFSHGDSGGPVLSSASFNSGGVLTIKGTGFSGAGPLKIEVNGQIVAPPLAIKVKGGGTKLKISGGASALNIKPGFNRLRVINNTLRSNLFVLSN